MNDFHLLATVHEFPRTVCKDPLEIRIKCNNIRDAVIPVPGARRTQHIAAEIPVHATLKVAESFQRILKRTRFLLISGIIDLDTQGKPKLIAKRFTHLPGQNQQAEDFIVELERRNEILRREDIPIIDLADSSGEIITENPDFNKGQEWT